MVMKNNSYTLFTASGCLSPEAFEQLGKGHLSADEEHAAMGHIHSCELCSLAFEGLAEVDINKVNSDLEEVKRRLLIVRPLDFMPEKRGLKMKLKIRIITFGVMILLAVAGILVIYYPTSKEVKPPIQDENQLPFRLEIKDTSAAMLLNKHSDKKNRWEQKLKKQQAIKERMRKEEPDSLLN